MELKNQTIYFRDEIGTVTLPTASDYHAYRSRQKTDHELFRILQEIKYYFDNVEKYEKYHPDTDQYSFAIKLGALSPTVSETLLTILRDLGWSVNMQTAKPPYETVLVISTKSENTETDSHDGTTDDFFTLGLF